MPILRRLVLAFASLVAFTLLATAAHPRPLAAQTHCISCTGDTMGPEVTITPGSGTYSGTASTYSLSVTIEWCDDHNLDANSRAITLNGVSVAGNFTYATSARAGCGAFARSTGTVSLHSGSNTLDAQIRDLTGNTGEWTESWSYSVQVPPTYTVAVTPDTEVLTPVAGAPVPVTFSVANTGNSSATYNLTVTCDTPLTNCPANPAPVTIAPNVPKAIPLTVTAGSAGSNPKIHLNAVYQSNSAIHDDGAITILAFGPQSPTVTTAEVNPGTTFDRSLCLTIAAGAGGASECGDLRLAHPLGSIRTVNRVRTPVLIYNSATVSTVVNLAAVVGRQPGAASPASMTATVTIGGAVGDTVTWPGGVLPAAAGARIVVPVSTTGLGPSNSATGLYPYTLEVTNHYTSENLKASANGELAVVDRRQSPFGAGWWLAGLERLYPQGNGILMWVGGDASVHRYTRSLQDTTYYFAPHLTRADTIKYDTTSHTWTRFASNGVRIHFDILGRHDSTTNRLGQVTAFSYLGTSDSLSGITVPRSPTTPTYQFRYDAVTHRLASVVLLPGSVDAQADSVVTGSDNRITSIIDPDGTSVGFGYRGSSALVTTRTDQRHHETWYAYDSANLLQSTTIDMGVAGPDTADIVTRYRPLQSTGYVAPVDTANVYTLLDGPLSTGDSTLFWLDRFGAPARIRNPLGSVTTITRGDVNWPALATVTRDPVGRVVVAEYDPVRGLLRSSTDSSTLSSNGAVAVTRYEWDSKWDMVTRVTSPAGDSVRMAYDPATGNRLWQEDGRGAVSQVTFTYTGDGLLKTIHMPGTTGDQLFVYDSQRLNLRHTRTALGYWNSSFADALGRDTMSVTPIDAADKDTLASSTYQRATVRTVYDAAGQDTLIVSTGPSLHISVLPAHGSAPDAPLEMLWVHKTYDAGGLVRALSRWSTPQADAGTVTTQWDYDNAGRKTREVAADGNIDSSSYDHAGNRVGERTRRGYRLGMDYDPAGQLVRRIIPAVSYPELANRSFYFGGTYPMYGDGLVIPADTETFAYDSAGRLVRAYNGEAHVDRSYYTNGLIKTDSLRIRTWLPLDSIGGSMGAHQYGLRYTYDLDGRRKTLEHPAQLAPDNYGADQYGYDAGGRLASVVDGFSNAFGFHYTAAGQLDSLSAPGNIYEKRTYDDDGRTVLRRTGLPAGSGTADTIVNEDNFSYDARGKVLGLSGLQESVMNGYSGLGSLVSVSRETEPNGADILDERFTVDALGNQITHSTQGASGATMVADGTSYHYTVGTGQLANTTADNSQAVGDSVYLQGSSVYAFDSSGNRTALDMVGTTADRSYSYYGADEKLRAVDHRVCIGVYYDGSAEGGCQPNYGGKWRGAFEWYRYDALGRRILVRALSDSVCTNGACLSTIQRIVWDGDQVLYEIRYPDGQGIEAQYQDSVFGRIKYYREEDTKEIQPRYINVNHCVRPSIDSNGEDMCPIDTLPMPNKQYGRSMYLHALGIDQPLLITRVGYIAESDEPVTLMPHANWRGLYVRSSVIDHNSVGCQDWVRQSTTCYPIDWPGDRIESYHLDRHANDLPPSWFGNLITEKRDASGQLYMRNRYYDPVTGRFTQEDPIGLAGGLNSYGFANGDPISYSDPFGLTADTVHYDGETVTVTDDDGNQTWSGPATSGRPGTTAANQGIEDVGPIPEGTYTFDPKQISTVTGFGFVMRGLSGINHGHPWSDWGNNRVTLTPAAGTDTKGRAGFFLHGGRSPGSAGCIDVGQGESTLFPLLKQATGPVTLIVRYPSPTTFTTSPVPTSSPYGYP